jgi:large subunit ribosomal protein L13
LKDNSPEVLIKAVKGMLPKNKWQNKLLTRLRVYNSTIHPHAAQKLESLEV